MMQPDWRTFLTQYACELPRVDLCNRLEVPAPQEFLKTDFRPPVAFIQGQIANNQAGRVDLLTFEIFAVGAGITDMGISQRNYLAGIGRIGKNFLIPGHRGIENHLTNSPAFGTD